MARSALKGEVKAYSSTAEAVSQLLRAGNLNIVLVFDLASVTDVGRTIGFVKWSVPLRHVRIIGVGSEEDCAMMEGAMELLDGCVRSPWTAEELERAVSDARKAKAVFYE
jgi:hypothetical protein